MSQKILFILMPENYRDEEFYEPYNMLTKSNYHVDVAGFKPGQARGIMGHEHTPNLLLDNLKNKDFDQYDVLAIPGGPASVKYLWGNKKIQKIIQYFHDNKKIVAAICYAAIAPVQTGILQNKKATVYPTDIAKGILSENKTIFVDKGCVTLSEEKIITAQGPAFAKEFGTEIIKLLEGS